MNREFYVVRERNYPEWDERVNKIQVLRRYQTEVDDGVWKWNEDVLSVKEVHDESDREELIQFAKDTVSGINGMPPRMDRILDATGKRPTPLWERGLVRVLDGIFRTYKSLRRKLK